MPNLVLITLGIWLAWDLLILAAMTWATRGRRRPPCQVVDLQAAALERARRTGQEQGR